MTRFSTEFAKLLIPFVNHTWRATTGQPEAACNHRQLLASQSMCTAPPIAPAPWVLLYCWKKSSHFLLFLAVVPCGLSWPITCSFLFTFVNPIAQRFFFLPCSSADFVVHLLQICHQWQLPGRSWCRYSSWSNHCRMHKPCTRKTLSFFSLLSSKKRKTNK